MKKLALQLFDYHTWANTKIIQHVSELSSALQSDQEDDTLNPIMEKMKHIYLIDTLWFSRIQQKSTNQVQENINDFHSLHKEMADFYKEMKEVLKNEHDVTRTISYRNSQEQRFTNSLFEIIQHIVNHGTYHRGNIAEIITSLNYKGVSTDYIYYLRERAQAK